MEDGEIETQKQIKKEVVEKFLNKENVEAKKATYPNPTSTRKATPKKTRTQIVATQIPNPNEVGIDEENKKKSTYE